MSKALVFAAYGGPETQELVERPAPTPGPGELAIEVKAAGVNPADWKIRAGQIGNVHKFTVIGVASAARQELVEAGHTAGKVIIEP